MADTAARPKKKRGMLSSFTIILILLAVVALITVVVAGFTKQVTPATFSDFFMAPAKGFVSAVDVCLFVMVLGGFLAMVNNSGALDAGISVLVKKLGGNELRLIPILMFIFSILGSTYGFCEETVGFYAILAAAMMAAGTDVLVGSAMILLGAGVGVLGSTVNPFAIGVASASLHSAGIEVNQGIVIALGLILWIVAYLISVFFVMGYAKKVKADKGKSILTRRELEASEAEYGHAAKNQTASLSGKQKAVLALFAISFLVMVVSFIPWSKFNINVFNLGFHETETTQAISAKEISSKWNDSNIGGTLELPGNVKGELTTTKVDHPAWSAWLTGAALGDWYFAESTTWFLIMAIIIGIVAGYSEKEIVDTFMSGAGDMMSVVLIIALARGVSVLMQATGLDTWVLNSAAAALKGTSAIIFAPASYVLYVILSFLIPSSSGMATVSMPIMGPLAKELGFSPEVMVQIFSSANGLVNLFSPTCGAIMGGLALARVEFGTWIKFAAKIVLLIAVASIVILTLATFLVHG